MRYTGDSAEENVDYKYTTHKQQIVTDTYEKQKLFHLPNEQLAPATPSVLTTIYLF